jgi:hypothetical protein
MPRVMPVTLSVLSLALGGAVAGAEPARSPRHLLEHTAAQVGGPLVDDDALRALPTIEDRAVWDAVPVEVRRAFIAEAQRQLDTGWSTLRATAFLDYVRDGNRSRYEALLFSRRHKLAVLVLGELLEARGRFLDEIADGVWLVCEESFWGVPAHLGAQRRGTGLPDVTEPIVDLFSAETSALLAWTSHLLGPRLDGVHPLLRQRIRLEVDRRMLTPALERDDFWWMGFTEREVNNWNPWINSNWLASLLFVETDPDRRERAFAKILRSLDRFVDVYADDGGCDEGPGYWGRAGGSLLDSLELVGTATRGRVDVFGAPVVRAIGQYIARAYIHGEYFINTGDAPARTTPEAELVYRYGRKIGDEALEGFGAFLARRRGPYGPADVPIFGSLGRAVPALRIAAEIAAATPREPLDGEVWLPDLQLMAARQAPGSSEGLYLAAWGGHNAQSHNHNDVGNFIVYADAAPVLVDAGVGEYTAKTFSPQRYEIWTMQSAWHNLPTINGVEQSAGAEFRARDVSFVSRGGSVRFSLDIAPAWPSSAGVERWVREITLDRRRGQVTLAESYVLDQWREPVRLSFMTPLAADVATPGRVTLSAADASGGGHVLRYDAQQFTATVEEKPLDDARLRAAWGERLLRVVLESRGRSRRGSYRIVVR